MKKYWQLVSFGIIFVLGLILARQSQAASFDFYGVPINFIKMFGQSSFGETSADTVVPSQINHAAGLAADTTTSTTKLYVADTGNNRILAFTDFQSSNPPATLIFGQGTTSSGACNGDNNLGIFKPASASSLCLIGLPVRTNIEEYWMRLNFDVDSQGNLYIPDVYNNRVLKYNQPFSIDKTNGKGDTVADFLWGQPDFSNNGINSGLGKTTRNSQSLYISSGGFDHVSSRGMSVDPQGNVWVADTFNFRILRFPPNSKTADLVIGQPDFTAPTSIGTQQTICSLSPTSRPLHQLCTPTLARVNPANGKLYVLDESPSGFKARILIYSPPFTNGMAADKVLMVQQPGPFANSSWQYYFQATGFTFNTYKTGEYAAGTIWINEHDARRTTLIDDNGTIIKVIGAPDTLHVGCDYAAYGACGKSIENNFNLCWPGGSPILANTGTGGAAQMFLADEQFHRIARINMPYTPTGQCVPEITQGFSPGLEPNSIGPRAIAGGTQGVISFSNQLIIKDKHRYLAWDNYTEPIAESQTPLIIGQTTSTSKTPNGLGSRSEHAIDDKNRLWITEDRSGNTTEGKIRIYQLPFQQSSTPIGINKQLFWADDPTTAISFDTFESGIAFDPFNKKLWIADRSNHRLLRVSNYDQFSTGKLLVDAVIGQPNKQSLKCNNTQDYGWTAPGSPTASSLCDPRLMEFDRKGNMYVVENTYECHGNNRIVMYEANDIGSISTLFPNTAAKKVWVRNSLTEKVICDANKTNEPYSPISLAFDSANHMVVGNDGYYGNEPDRAWRQLWYYCDPLKKVSGSYIQGQKPDAYIKLPLGAAGEIQFDLQDNLIVQDHTWAKVWILNYTTDPNWLVSVNGGSIACSASSLTPTPTPTSQPPSPTPSPKPGDVNGDTVVNLADLSTLLSNFGKPNMLRNQGDLDGSGTVNLSDLSILLSNFGK